MSGSANKNVPRRQQSQQIPDRTRIHGGDILTESKIDKARGVRVPSANRGASDTEAERRL